MTFIYLALALLIALTGAYTDIKFGRVRNKHLIIALIIWLVLILSGLNVPAFSFALNVSLSIITSIIFYLTDIWAPGDCKLYIVIAIIFPISAHSKNIFPALNFVIYSFALGYIFLVFTHKASEKTKANLNFNLKHAILNAGIISLVNAILDTSVPEFLHANQILCTLFSVMLIFVMPDMLRKIIGLIGLISFLGHISLMNLTMSLVVAFLIEYITNRSRNEVTAEKIPFAPFIAGSVVIQILRFVFWARKETLCQITLYLSAEFAIPTVLCVHTRNISGSIRNLNH